MAFGERLKELRVASGMSQQSLANAVNVSLRTIQNYEGNKSYPKNMSIVKHLTDILNAPLETLMDEVDLQLVNAGERGGGKAQRDIKVLANQVTALFAGGELDDDDKDAAMRAITDAYWNAKAKNQKYTPKKYRK